MENITQAEIAKIVQQTTIETLKMVGLLKTIYKRSEVERLYGRSAFEKSKFYVKWQKKGKSLICQRSEFENYLSKFDIELKKL